MAVKEGRQLPMVRRQRLAEVGAVMQAMGLEAMAVML